MIRTRLTILLAVVGLIVVASVITYRLGDPLGMVTRTPVWRSLSVQDPVTILCTEPDRDLTHLAEQAAAFMDAAGKRFGITPQAVSIRLFATASAYRAHGLAVLPGFTPAMDYCFCPADRAIYGYVDRESDMLRRIRHELFHALVRQNRPPPLWLDEGTAALCEDLELVDGILVPKDIQIDRFRAAARAAVADPPLLPATLATAAAERFYGAKGYRHYSASYACAWMLFDTDRLTSSLHDGAPLLDAQTYLAFVSDADQWSTVRDRVAQRERSTATAKIPPPSPTTSPAHGGGVAGGRPADGP